MGRGALLTGMVGGIIGTITAVIGIAWSVLTVVGAYDYIFVPIYGIGLFPLYSGPSMLLVALTILFVVILFVACILTGIGFYGMYTAGGGAMGVVALIFAIIGGVAASIFTLLGVFASSGAFYYSPYSYILAWSWIGFIIFGVSFIIIGSASIAVREVSTHSGTAVAAGILSIIGGSALIISFLFFFIWIGLALLFVAFLLWAIVFYGTEA
ncbi:MAG: hypothetical protein ACETWM_13100 [Candidatus Lokiarchaeia archaeon]